MFRHPNIIEVFISVVIMFSLVLGYLDVIVIYVGILHHGCLSVYVISAHASL